MKASKVFFLVFLVMMSLCAVNTRPVKSQSSGTIYIKADGTVEGTDKIQRDGNVYTFTGNIYDSIVVGRDNIVVDGAGYNVQGDGSGTGINLTRRSNVTIMNMKIKDFRHGIFHEYFEIPIPSSENITNNNDGVHLSYSNNTISGNTITNNLYGVHLSCAFGNTISGNNITNNGDGIALGINSHYNALVGNTITNNYNGILLKPSHNNNISGNTITNNWYGIDVSDSSDNNSIFGNNITANGYCGIFLDDHSSLSTIVENNITNNYNGIYLGESSNNHIYHNNFMSNTQQVYTCNLTNVWDNGYPSGGNYWSDYEERYPKATEIDGSGIWDTPYVIDKNNQDNYPLMDEGGKFEPYVSTFHLLFEDGSHKLLGNLSGEIRITEPEKEIIHSICKLSLSSPRLDEYHEPYIHKVELITAWGFIIHGWGPVEIPQPPPYPEKVTLYADEEIILFDHSDNVSGFENEPRIVFGFSRGLKITPAPWGAQILPTIRVYLSDGQEWEWKYEYKVTIPFMLWSGIEANLSELSGKIETETITFTTVKKGYPIIITSVRVIILASIIVAVAVAAVFVKYRKKQ